MDLDFEGPTKNMYMKNSNKRILVNGFLVRLTNIIPETLLATTTITDRSQYFTQ